MKITEQEVKKLKQLDRIEFRQRYKLLNDNQITFGVTDFLWKILIVIGFIMVLIAIFFVGGYKDISLRLTNTILLTLKISIIMVFIFGVLDFISYLKYFYDKEKLFKEYFSNDVKVRGNIK
jgi:uncharacterized integral membrane protein